MATTEELKRAVDLLLANPEVQALSQQQPAASVDIAPVQSNAPLLNTTDLPVTEEVPEEPLLTEQSPVPQEEIIEEPVITGSDPLADPSTQLQNVLVAEDEEGNVIADSGADPLSDDLGGAQLINSDIDTENQTELLTVDDLKDLSFEDIVRLTTPESQLPYAVKYALAEELRGATTSGLGEVFLGGGTQGIAGASDVEKLLEEKYQQFIDDNPDMDPGLLGRIGASIRTGSPVGEIFEDVIPLQNEFAAQINNLGLSATAGLGDDLYRLIGADAAANQLEASREQLGENDIVGDQIITDLLGAAIPGTAIARGIQEATSLGRTSSTALAGALEGGLFGAGYSEGESVGEVASDAATGALIGGITAGAAERIIPFLGRQAANLGDSIGGVFSERIRTSGASRRAVRNLSSEIKKKSGGQVNLTEEDILNNIDNGKRISLSMIEQGMRPDQVQEVLNGLTGGSRRLLNELEVLSNDIITTEKRNLGEQLVQTGERLNIARRSGSVENVNEVIRDSINSDQGGAFLNDVLKPTLRNFIHNNDSVAKSAGYKRGPQAAKNIFVNEDTGKMYIIKKGKKAEFDRLRNEGTINNELIEEVRPVGTFITRLEERSAARQAPALRPGETPQQTEGFEDLLPVTENIRSSERRLSPEVQALASDNAFIRRQQEAVQAGSRGPQSRAEFVSELESAVGKKSTLSAEQKQSLEFLANEMDVLRGSGRASSTDTTLPSFVADAASAARIGGVFGGTIPSIFRIAGIQALYRQARKFFNVGSVTELGRLERSQLRVIQALLNSSDDEITSLVSGAIRRGINTSEGLANFVQQSAPALSGYTQISSPSSEDEMMTALGAQ